MKFLKDIIRERRLEKGLTMKELSLRIGVSEGTISRWESGEITSMRVKAAAALSRVLDISPSVLLTGKEEDYMTIKQLHSNLLLEIFNEYSSHYSSSPTLSSFSQLSEEEIHTLLQLYEQLDANDRSEIRGEIKGMLKAAKYKNTNHTSNSE